MKTEAFEIVGPVVAVPSPTSIAKITYSVTLPSGFVATGPDAFPRRAEPQPEGSKDSARRPA